MNAARSQQALQLTDTSSPCKLCCDFVWKCGGLIPCSQIVFTRAVGFFEALVSQGPYKIFAPLFRLACAWIAILYAQAPLSLASLFRLKCVSYALWLLLYCFSDLFLDRSTSIVRYVKLS